MAYLVCLKPSNGLIYRGLFFGSLGMPKFIVFTVEILVFCMFFGYLIYIS